MKYNDPVSYNPKQYTYNSVLVIII